MWSIRFLCIVPPGARVFTTIPAVAAVRTANILVIELLSILYTPAELVIQIPYTSCSIFAFLQSPLILLPAILMGPVPIAPYNSIDTIGVITCDTIFFTVLSAIFTEFVPRTTIPFVYTVLVGLLIGGVPVKVAL